MYWYDIVCVGIVAAAVVGAIVVLLQNEGKGIKAWSGQGEPKYESLALPTLEEDQESHYTKGFVSSMCLWMTCWRCLHPAILGVFRFVAFIIMLLLLIWDIKIWTWTIFAYYTEWTFALVIIYFGLATLVSANGCHQLAKRYYTKNENERAKFLKTDPEQEVNISETENQLERGLLKLNSHQEWEQQQKKRANFWGYTMQIIYQTCAGAVVMTDVVFWLVIVPFLKTERFTVDFLMGSMHTVNAAFLLIDAGLNSMRFPWFRGAYFVLWTSLYVIVQWILHACGMPWWPYPFLELSTAWAPLWYFCLAIVCIICYGIFALFIKLKESCFPKWFPYAYQCLY